MGDSSLDKQISDHHKSNPWSVKQEELEAMLDTAEVQEQLFFGKTLIVCYKLQGTGWTVFGDCAVVREDKFDWDIGRKLCRERAMGKLWQVVGYQVQCELARAKASKAAEGDDFVYVSPVIQERNPQPVTAIVSEPTPEPNT